MYQKFQKVTATETALLSGKTYLVLKHLHINRQNRAGHPLQGSGAGAEASLLPASHVAFFKTSVPPITV